MHKTKRKLRLDRVTVRALTPSDTRRVRGGMRMSDGPDTTTTVLTCDKSHCNVSICVSCGNSDCCLEPP